MKKFLQHILTHPYATVTLVGLTIMGIGAVGKHSSEWDETYVRAAKLLLSGGDMYRDFIGYVYPPFSAWVTIPFTVFPPRVARAIWYVISALCLIYIVKTSWRLAGGPRLEPADRAPAASGGEQIAFLIAQVCVLQLALNALTHLQPDLLIAALLMAGIAALIDRRFLVAATWIGMSGAFKVTPLLFAPYLLWRRKWVAAGWVLLLAVAVNLLPDTVHRPRGGGTWVGEWARRVLAPMTRSDFVPGNWANKVNNNQALSGAVKRWMATTWTAGKDEVIVGPRPGAASAGAMRNVFAVVGIATLLPVGIAMWRRRSDRERDTTVQSSPGFSPPTVAAIECGIVLLLMLLFSPNSSRSHFCIMYLPAFCVARIAVRPGASPLLRTLLVLAAISSTLSIHIRLPSTMLAEQVLLWLGVVMFCALFLLLACSLALTETTPFKTEKSLAHEEAGNRSAP